MAHPVFKTGRAGQPPAWKVRFLRRVVAGESSVCSGFLVVIGLVVDCGRLSRLGGPRVCGGKRQSRGLSRSSGVSRAAAWCGLAPRWPVSLDCAQEGCSARVGLLIGVPADRLKRPAVTLASGRTRKQGRPPHRRILTSATSPKESCDLKSTQIVKALAREFPGAAGLRLKQPRRSRDRSAPIRGISSRCRRGYSVLKRRSGSPVRSDAWSSPGVSLRPATAD